MCDKIRDYIVLETNISKAFWCSPDVDGTYNFNPSKIAIPYKTKSKFQEISWLDQLFEGGIVLPHLPENQNRAITILLTGSPGSGKSTLAMELFCKEFNSCFFCKKFY